MTVTLYKWTLDRYHAAIDAGLFEDQAIERLRFAIWPRANTKPN